MARSTLARHRKTFGVARFAREGNDGGGGGNGGNGGQNGGGNDSGQNGGGGGGSNDGGGNNADGGSNTGGEPDRGFPPNTPLVEMTVDQQAAYHKYHSRQWQQRAESRSDYDEQKRLADLYKAQQRQSETPSETQLREAEERGMAAATAAKDEEQVQNLLRVSLAARVKEGTDVEDLVLAANPKAFITDGKVDAAKVSSYAARIAGTAGSDSNGGQNGGSRDLGQGRRENGAKPSVGAGRDLFAERNKSRQTAGA